MSSIKMFNILNLIFILTLVKTEEKQRIPHAKLVTPSNEEMENTEPSPIIIKDYTLGPETRIIGGEKTSIADYPFMVNIVRDRDHWCGGSYIAPNWILTAAHCLLHPRTYGLASFRSFRVRMGATNLDDKYFQERQALNLIPHQDFHVYNNTCDIGLIEIEHPFYLSQKVKYATLPNYFDTYEDENCTVIGWGVTTAQGDQFSNHLMKVTVPIVPERICQKVYIQPKYRSLFRGYKTLCAGYVNGGRDACQGDSGGPLILRGTQIGIVSWGIGCGNEIPGVYTNVYYYRKWISDVMLRKIVISQRSGCGNSKSSVAILLILYGGLRSQPI